MHKKLGLIIFALIILALPVATLATLPAEATPFSENENRYLEAFPTLSIKNILNESFMEGFDTWLSDRFIGRENWISAMNTAELALGKTEVSTVATVGDQMMQVLSEYDDIGSEYDADLISTNLSVIQSFADDHADKEVYFMLVPTSVGIYGESLLSSTVTDVSINQQTMIWSCYASLNNITCINVYDALASASSDYIYYRTDHHWTSLGAYTAYSTAANVLGYDAFALSDFSVDTASSAFQGTLFSKTLDQTVTKDDIHLYALANGTTVSTLTTSNGVTSETYDSIFFTEYLNVKDKYSTYTGENMAVVTVESTHADESACDHKSILIIKDSYANSLVQFLVNNYDTVTMIDLRYTNMTIDQLVDVDAYDQILILYNCITFSDDGDLIKLGF